MVDRCASHVEGNVEFHVKTRAPLGRSFGTSIDESAVDDETKLRLELDRPA